MQIDGVLMHSPQAGAIEAALVDSARGMSTLDVKQAVLRAAVARFPVVRSLRTRASFPHGLLVEVVEQQPVAALVSAGARTAVAADGVVLGSGHLSNSLPVLSPGRGAAASAPVVGRSVHEPSLRAELLVLGVAPAPLGQLVTRAYTGPYGLTVRAGNVSLPAYFGDAARPDERVAFAGARAR